MADATIKKVEKILTSEYSTQNFLSLVQEIFATFRIIAPNSFRKEFTNFSSHIEGSTHIGDYVTDENEKIAVFAVQLKKDAFVERSRSTQRNYAKKLIESGNCEAALVAFYTAENPKWRLSFVRLDYQMKIEKGSLKAVENLTPAKRYSFLVGKDEPCHTAIDHFRCFIVDSNSKPSLSDIEEAFSVEKVTKEFFDLYREKYLQLREHLDDNEDFVAESQKCGFTSEQFAKKLMGQIVFLYFLQKKGWLGVHAWKSILTEKEYKNVFFVSGAQGRIIKEYLPKVYSLQADGTYRLNSRALDEIPDDAEELIANNVKSEETWGDGSRRFLRTLFDYSQKHKKHFYEEYLEPLFYDTLNRNRGVWGYCPALHCRIPFLSGGLFEPLDGYDWKSNYFDIPDEMFSNKKDEYDLDADGILDIFDRYNFTMSEDEPMEREVAIDPEMLGKVFENLLEVKDRKSSGSFYTPREIVHYMCRESLINYLVKKTGISEMAIRDFIIYGDFMKDEDTDQRKRELNEGLYISDEIFEMDVASNTVTFSRIQEIDDALATVRIADPAVGSGAFPLGMVNEIVRARENISAYMSISMNKQARWFMYSNDRSPYALKIHTIKNSIFAVDIEPSAVDITQLRLWLSIVIDDEINPKATNELDGHKNPLPLPNLECNILCGNSLIDEFEGIKLINESDLISTSKKGNSQIDLYHSEFEAILLKLLAKQNELFHCDDTLKKEELKKSIQSFKDLIVQKQMQGCAEATKVAYQLAVKQNSSPFILWQLDFARVFKENGGFDIVIGNPPYIGEEGHKELFQTVASTRFGNNYYIGKMDFWYFFVSKGIELLTPKGALSFIAPNNWMTTAGGKRMRAHIANEMRIRKFVTFNNVMIFESASQQTMIFLLEKEKMEDCYTVDYKEIGNQQLDSQNLTEFLSGNNIGNNYTSTYNPIENADGKSIQFLNANVNNLINKIASSDRLYLEKNEILNGIHPHHGAVTKKMLPLLPEGANVGDGIFILSLDEIERLNLTKEEKTLLKPYYDTNGIGKYYFNDVYNFMIIYTTSDFKDVSLMDKYPNIKKHLDYYVNVITSDNRPYGLHRARQQEFFDEPAIASLRKCQTPTFSYLDKQAYLTAEWYLIKTDRINMKFLTCLLNSALIKYWLLKMGKMQGSIFQVDKEPLMNIPIVNPSPKAVNEVVNLYDKIAQKRKSDKDADISDIENDIDTLIFSEYGLDDKDISLLRSELLSWCNKS